MNTNIIIATFLVFITSMATAQQYGGYNDGPTQQRRVQYSSQQTRKQLAEKHEHHVQVRGEMTTTEVNAIMTNCPYQDGPERIIWRAMKCSSRTNQSSTEASLDAIAALTGGDPERATNSAKNCRLMAAKASEAAKKDVAQGEHYAWCNEDAEAYIEGAIALEKWVAVNKTPVKHTSTATPEMLDKVRGPQSPPRQVIVEEKTTVETVRPKSAPSVTKRPKLE